MLGSKLSPLALLVIELLMERDLHPYEMRQLLLERRRDLRVRITPGSLYRTVERLAEDGLIEVVETSRAGKRPERTVYTLTDYGRDSFAERLRDMVVKPVLEYPQYASALACIHSLTKDDAIAKLTQRRMELEALVAAHDVVIENLGKKVCKPIHWIDVEYDQAMRRAELAWTTHLIDDLTSGMMEWT